MSLFPLDIFPAGGLASSVITTVWIGVIVITFFNLRFGTTLSGLVVPGYLVPLFIVKPVSAWVIIVESLLTYLIARLVAGEALKRVGLGEMFGRDRFFMLILISILVRIIFDAFLLPDLAVYLKDNGVPYDLRTGLHSFGLIIIALCANQFWNGGLRSGAYSLSIYLGITYLLINYLLIPLTNFNISTLGYMYDDVASSILASPKAYIILITAAFVASRLNLRYGWDFNGILIPSLLALQWYDPVKILSTFVEAFIIYFGAQLALRIPVFSKINIEGSRQLLFFFTVGFIYKWLLGFLVISWFPEHKVTDYYGFGYLLATLMAIKMYDKNIAIRFTRTTLQTSLIAALIASAIGFSLTLIQWETREQAYAQLQPVEIIESPLTLTDFVRDVRIETYRSKQQLNNIPIPPLEIERFRGLFKSVGKIDSSLPEKELGLLEAEAQLLGYQLTLVEQRYLVLHEMNPERGWGFYVVDSQSKNQLLIEVPRALEEVSVSIAADRIFSELGARYLAFSGARSKRSKDQTDDVLINANSLFQIFHQALVADNTVQLRGFSERTVTELFGRGIAAKAQEKISTTVWVKRTLPADLPLAEMEGIVGQFDLHWQSPAIENRQRDTAIGGFVEIYLSNESILSLYAHRGQQDILSEVAQEQRIDGYLQSYLANNRIKIAARFSELYQPADKFDLLYVDQAILTPLLTLVENYQDSGWTQSQRRQLAHLSNLAAGINYEIIRYHHKGTNENYLILKEREDNKHKRYWGTYVFKLGASSNYIVEVPSALAEQHTFEFGSVLFERLKSKVVLISGAHPWSNADGSARLMVGENQNTLFNVVHQRVVSFYAEKEPYVVQIRGYQQSLSQQHSSAILAPLAYQQPGAYKHPSLSYLQNQLQSLGLSPVLHDPYQLSDFYARLNAQSRYNKFVSGAQYATVWLPSSVRDRFEYYREGNLLLLKFEALGVDVKTVDISPWLSAREFMTIEQKRFDDFAYFIKGFLASENIQFLFELQQQYSDWKISLLADNTTAAHFMALENASGQLVAVINLNSANEHQQLLDGPSWQQGRKQQTVSDYIEQRKRWLWRFD
jgi:hypothetical protein